MAGSVDPGSYIPSGNINCGFYRQDYISGGWGCNQGYYPICVKMWEKGTLVAEYCAGCVRGLEITLDFPNDKWMFQKFDMELVECKPGVCNMLAGHLGECTLVDL